MTTVNPADVLAYMGRDVSVTEYPAIGQKIDIVTHMVKAFTRGQGFTAGEPDDAIAAVIVSCTARLAENPMHERQHSVTVDDGTVATSPGIFNGWTLPELAILHTYRRRAH